MAIDYNKERDEFKAELKAGVYDLDISPNEGVDYQTIEDRDLLAFKEDLDSSSFKALAAETFGK